MARLWRLGGFRTALLLRGAAAWTIVRMALAFGKVGDPSLLMEVGIVALAGWLVVLDARRRDEDLFLANLGVSRWPIAVVGALGALPLELLVP